MQIIPRLAAAFADVAAIMAPAAHDWWIIGSAGAALHGVDPGSIADIDILFDLHDLERISGHTAVRFAAGTSDGRFRSQMFGRYLEGTLPVELFAGFQLCEHGAWTAIHPRSRVTINHDGCLLHTLEKAELHELFVRFGRSKDLQRAARLKTSGLSPSTQ